MKNIQLLYMLGEVYDKFVAEAKSEKKMINRLWFRVGGIAAAVLVVVGVVFAVLVFNKPNVPVVNVAEVFVVEENTIVDVTDKLETYLSQNDGALTVSSQIGNNTVNEIGDYAFMNCKGLKSVVIEDSITYIGYGAFEGCTSLEKITVPFVGRNEQTQTAGLDFLFASSEEPSLYAEKELGTTSVSHFGYIFGARTYADNGTFVPKSLEEVVITGEGDIKEHAFYACDGIKRIDLNYGAGIADNAFEGCECVFLLKMPGISDVIRLDALDNVSSLFYILADNLLKKGTAGYKSFVFKDGVLIDENYSFCGASFYVGEVVDNRMAENRVFEGKAIVWGNSASIIPADGSVNIVGAHAFAGSALEQISVPGGIALADYAFSGCEKLSCVVFEDGATTVQGRNVFENCTSLKKVVLPDGFTDLGYFTFYGCTSLAEINLPEGMTELKDGVFQWCGFETIDLPETLTRISIYVFANCEKLREIEVPDSVTYIGNMAFMTDVSLKEISLPMSLTRICEVAFGSCRSLETVVIPDGVTIIDSAAFYDCVSLKTVVVPDSVTAIHPQAFLGCTALEEIVLPASVTDISANAFEPTTTIIRK